MDIVQRIESLLEKTLQAVSAAAERCDFATLQQLSRKGQRLKELRDRVADAERELRELENGLSGRPVTSERTRQSEPRDAASGPLPPDEEPIQGGSRNSLVIEVTQGMINQNLLTLTDHVKSGRIRVGSEMKIEARPSGELFCTDLLGDGNRLRERGAIARFYRDARVHAGDKVVLTQESPNRWTLEKVHQGPSSVPPTIRQSDDQI